jgi:hypothetical protein
MMDIVASSQEAQYYAEAEVTILEAAEEALEGIASVISGGISGGVGSLLRLRSMRLEQIGSSSAAATLETLSYVAKSAQLIKGGLDLLRSVKIVVPAVNNAGVKFVNVLRGEVGDMGAGDLWQPIFEGAVNAMVDIGPVVTQKAWGYVEKLFDW